MFSIFLLPFFFFLKYHISLGAINYSCKPQSTSDSGRLSYQHTQASREQQVLFSQLRCLLASSSWSHAPLDGPGCLRTSDSASGLLPLTSGPASLSVLYSDQCYLVVIFRGLLQSQCIFSSCFIKGHPCVQPRIVRPMMPLPRVPFCLFYSTVFSYTHWTLVLSLWIDLSWHSFNPNC